MRPIAIGRLGAAVMLALTARTALAWRGAQVDSIGHSREGKANKSGSAATVTEVSMRNVNFYVTPKAALRIRHLRGTMRPLRGDAVVFDGKNSFVMHMAYAEIGLSGPDLSTLLNTVVFAYRGAPLRRMRVRMEGAHVVQTGILHKLVDIPFEITSEPSVTPQGLIRLRPVKTRILGVDGDGLLRAFGQLDR